MLLKVRLQPENGKRSLSRNVQQNEATRLEESSKNESSEIAIEIDGQDGIYSVAFLTQNVGHIVSGDDHGKIRRWGVEDGNEMGTPMDGGSAIVYDLAVSRDGKWVVSGMSGGQVAVWSTETLERVVEFRGHGKAAVYVVDISPDATKIATGSYDESASVWSLSTGKRLLGPLVHDHHVVAVRFSPDGCLIATATWAHASLRIYDSRDGHLLVDFSIQVNSSSNQSLAWLGDSKQLFALSHDGDIHRLNVSTKKKLSKWAIHNNYSPGSVSLASNGAFIAASDDSSISFWDTTTHKQIGPVIHHPARVLSMAISADYDLVTGGGTKITLRNLCDILPSPYFGDIPEIRRARAEARLKETIQSLRAQHEHSNEKITDLERTIERLRAELAHSRTELVDSKQKVNSLTQILCAHQQKNRCETLYADGQVIDAAQFLLEIVKTASEDIKADTFIMNWLSGFTNKCIIALERVGDDASKIKKHDEALAAYSTALSLGCSTADGLLIKWASTMLLHSSTDEALDVAARFKVPKFITHRTICDLLEGNGSVMDAIRCFQELQSELPVDASIPDERAQWELSFRRRCIWRLEMLADVAMGSRNYNEASEHFSSILLLDPTDRVDPLVKRSKARAMMKLWEDALKDADEVIKLDPSSHQGHEQRHAALLGAGHHAEAVEAFDTMLSKLEESRDERVRELRCRYVDARPTIRRIIDATISHMPRVLIDTTTGQLHDRSQQIEAFESLPLFSELVSSMTTEVDYARLWREVKQFYRYVMFSHKWEPGEPLFQDVKHITVFELGVSPMNTKLQRFCLLVRSLGFRWAWSDTCCIDKANNVVLQESLVAMFSWYRGSSLTLVYLRGVLSQSQKPGGLQWSIWNTRAWTYQEYLAAERVQFYTEDWKPYLGLTLLNHKESPIIVSEMEQVSQVSARQSAVLQPGLDRVREKLYLASTRQTTLVEDIAYSLLGIFNAAIPVIYGEGDRAVGRLLEHILSGSGDVTILAWTGTAGYYNSCLPTNLDVYNQPVPPHIPPFMEVAEIDRIVAESFSSLSDLTLVTRLFDRLSELPSPSLVSSRLRLSGIVSRVTEVVHMSGPDTKTKLCTYHATTTMFGGIEIKTVNNLTMMNDLYLVHPWIHPLLDQEFSRAEVGPDKTKQAFRLVTRLQQPFGALLFEQLSRIDYKRVAADSLIMVQISKGVPLTDLIDKIRTIDVR